MCCNVGASFDVMCHDLLCDGDLALFAVQGLVERFQLLLGVLAVLLFGQYTMNACTSSFSCASLEASWTGVSMLVVFMTGGPDRGRTPCGPVDLPLVAEETT